MGNSISWQRELGSFLKSGTPEQAETASLWLCAIGLQGVDGLEPSQYLVKAALRHVRGKITLSQLKSQLYRHYRWHRHSKDLGRDTWEADLVSLHIVELLLEPGFRFEPMELRRIHHHLFEDVYDFAGNFRDYDISKRETVLGGESVNYLDYPLIPQALDRIFAEEQKFTYRGLPPQQIIRRLAQFISAVWIIHPYGEGNTRTTAVFLMKYLKARHLKMRREVFAGNAWYFRNSLVRANYADTQQEVFPTYEFLERFLENLLLKKDNVLVSRHMSISFQW